jgi:HRDC domain
MLKDGSLSVKGGFLQLAENKPKPVVETKTRESKPTETKVAKPSTKILESNELIEALQTYRTSQSKLEGMPPYIIYSNKVLTSIAQIKPKTLNALLEIDGVGKAKVEKYGAAILEIVKNSAVGALLLDPKTAPSWFQDAPSGGTANGLGSLAAPSDADIPKQKKPRETTPQKEPESRATKPLIPTGAPHFGGDGLRPSLTGKIPFSNAAELLELIAQNQNFDPALLEKTLSDLPEAQLPRALEALGKLNARFEVVRPYLDHASETVAAAAITTLNALDPSFNMDFLLDDPRPRVRLAAVRISSDKRKLEQLCKLETVAYVRTAASVAVWKLEV